MAKRDRKSEGMIDNISKKEGSKELRQKWMINYYKNK